MAKARMTKCIPQPFAKGAKPDANRDDAPMGSPAALQDYQLWEVEFEYELADPSSTTGASIVRQAHGCLSVCSQTASSAA